MNETDIRELLDALKSRDALIRTLQESVVLQARELGDLTARVAAFETSQLRLVEIIKRSVVKLDEPKLGTN